MAHTTRSRPAGPRILVAGGGVAGLEAMLTLRALAGELVDVELIAPEPAFYYRPLAVVEPFGRGRVARFELSSICERIGAAFTLDRLASVDVERRRARSSRGTEIAYDVLLVATGALPGRSVDGALTFRGPADTDRLRRLLTEVEVRPEPTLVFAVAGGPGWPLPIYELALLSKAELDERCPAARVVLVTGEQQPLQIFGPQASTVVGRLLEERGVTFLGDRRPLAFDGAVLRTGEGELACDGVIASPMLEGQRIYGLPHDADGFLATDRQGLVEELTDVYAAGDVTAQPIKQGGLGAQQATAAATAIAASLGAAVEPHRNQAILRGVLVTGREPLYLRRRLSDPHDPGTASTDPLWWPPAKIVGRLLAPFLGLMPPDTPPLPDAEP